LRAFLLPRVSLETGVAKAQTPDIPYYGNIYTRKQSSGQHKNRFFPTGLATYETNIQA
jgi:hypothetical protein